MNAVIETQPFAATEGEAYRQRALKAGEAFLKAVDAILPVLRAGREQSERECRVPDASVEAMLDAGVFRSLTPLQYGGLELSPADFYDGLMRIAQCDSSAAWIAGQIVCHNLEIAAMDPQMHEDFWGVYGPDARASSSYAPLGKTEPTKGGYILDGRWTFSSGVDFAHYVVLGGGERNFLVPIKDLVIDHDSWDVQGLRGTGSKAVTANKVFVPNHRIHVMVDVVNDINPGYEAIQTPLYRGVSWMTVFYATAANTVIGTALEGVNLFLEQSRNRYTKMGTGARLAENPILHLKLADALTRINDIRTRTLNNWRHIFDQACKGEPISHLERLRVRFESADSFAACFDVLHDIWPMVGAVASQSSNPMQLIFRNLMAARTHGTGGKELAASAYSRALLGLPAPEFKVNDFATAAYWR
ncbi:acyl-CoA dehydrogenase [Paraburkholderia youngii]|uniref:Acyl-CoA dehydrogenase n=1 Tax=Paraburkholderia youngii TaxID=2782701 RepID=A0A7Y6N3X5_9BURK|nr:acyl-CoA dehydrogenase [Paraburkholderia youngii]NUY04939.1 acyl-CoA dehydrogenase [Paraburkholderia youngii]